MKVLWIVNMVLPRLANYLDIKTGSSGTWMIDISERLSKNKDIKLGIACVYGDEFRMIEIDNIKYYMLPGNGKNMLFYTKKYEKLWSKVYEDFKPDLVHLHGTEYSHGLSFLRTFPHVKSIVSIQGILERIKDVDFGGLKYNEVIKNRTFKENIHFNGMIEMHLMHKKNSKYEKEILNRVQYANCVNYWDSTLVKYINPEIECYKIEYNLRKEFYNAPKWSIEKSKPYTIFTNPGGTPLKGLHMLIKALAIVKSYYPSVKLIVPGMGNENKQLIVNSGYTKYLSKLIKVLNLTNNIIFLGKQSGDEMIQKMLESNVVVIPSAIEGTSLILREAMFLGVPCITSFRGGMADFISDKFDGFLYDYQEFAYLANRIMELFENRELCMQFSRNAITKAEKAHEVNDNNLFYINMYKQIMSRH